MSERLKRGFRGLVSVHLDREARTCGTGRRIILATVGSKRVRLQKAAGRAVTVMSRLLFDQIWTSARSPGFVVEARGEASETELESIESTEESA
jgi:hypothetical protein